MDCYTRIVNALGARVDRRNRSNADRRAERNEKAPARSYHALCTYSEAALLDNMPRPLKPPIRQART